MDQGPWCGLSLNTVHIVSPARSTQGPRPGSQCLKSHSLKPVRRSARNPTGRQTSTERAHRRARVSRAPPWPAKGARSPLPPYVRIPLRIPAIELQGHTHFACYVGGWTRVLPGLHGVCMWSMGWSSQHPCPSTHSMFVCWSLLGGKTCLSAHHTVQKGRALTVMCCH